MQTRKVGELVLDFDVYPRMSVDTQHISYMREAVEAGVKMPPLIICAKSLRVVDGFHRCKMYLSMYGGDHVVDTIEKKYPTDAALFADAMRYNATHGRLLSRYDRVHCALVAAKLSLSVEDTASALGMTVEKLKELHVTRVATVVIPGRKGEQVPLKGSIRHMRGKSLTPEQVDTNRHLSGMNQVFHVNQLIALIENELLDTANDDLMQRLRHLGELIQKLKVTA
jgi:hypothetical protein